MSDQETLGQASQEQGNVGMKIRGEPRPNPMWQPKKWTHTGNNPRQGSTNSNFSHGSEGGGNENKENDIRVLGRKQVEARGGELHFVYCHV